MGTLGVMSWQVVTGKVRAPKQELLNSLGIEGSWRVDSVAHGILTLRVIASD